MIKESVTIDRTIEILNEALMLDPRAMTDLCESRVRCNDALTEHPTIQVGPTWSSKENQVGLIGIINGLFGVDDRGYGPIAANYTTDEPVSRIVEFVRTPPPKNEAARNEVQDGQYVQREDKQ